MIKIKARFKGKDGSLGYKNGKEYELIFWASFNQVWIRRIEVLDNQRGYCKCPYDSLALFLQNWDVIQ